MNDDPTMNILERFKNSALWDHIDRGVPIFKPHTAMLFNPSTGKADLKAVYDVPRLEKMVSILKRLYQESGVAPRITIGHTKLPLTKVSQEEQPEIVGYMVNPRVGTFGPAKTPAILVDRYFLPGRWERAKEYPYRSPEFYSEENAKLIPSISKEHYDAITSVALLKTDPKLDMGLTLYAESGINCYAEAMMDPTSLPATPVAPAEPGLHDEFKTHFKSCMGEMYPHMEQYYRDHIQSKYALAAPSPTNTEVPGEPKPEPKPEAPREQMGQTTPPTAAPAITTPSALDEANRMHREQIAAVQAQYQRGMDALQAQVKELQAKTLASERAAVLAQYERDLTHLQNQGYQFTLSEEMADCADMDQPSFDKHKKRVQSHYQRVPIGGGDLRKIGSDTIMPNQALGIAEEEEFGDGDIMPAVHYMEKHGCTWPEAMAAIETEKKSKKKTA